ncbi:hypothetical protein C5167_040060 [Papaver somniferum]|uniref:Helicase C-terminal domain-containing protein n=1 Tax=Papaver somniferum TaxID=3469 RepID=A0A4Y7IHB2_PAPSO|nr:hypothetical protein C5167_040060 [Papaver somniferum]
MAKYHLNRLLQALIKPKLGFNQSIIMNSISTNKGISNITTDLIKPISGFLHQRRFSTSNVPNKPGGGEDNNVREVIVTWARATLIIRTAVAIQQRALNLALGKLLIALTVRQIVDTSNRDNIHAHACIGGQIVGEDIRKLENGVHVVSGTPGRQVHEGPVRILVKRDELTLEVDWLTEMMGSYNFTVSSMHGNMPQKERDAITKEFRSGNTGSSIDFGNYMYSQVHACIGGRSVCEDTRKLEDGVHVVRIHQGEFVILSREDLYVVELSNF